MIRRLLPAVAVCLFASACVWPVPLPGEPVPSITVTSEWSATASTIDVEVTTLNFTPATVRIHPHGVNAPALVDNTAPFEFSIDATSLALGDHQMLVVATDWSTYVVEFVTLEVSGCNGSQHLCGEAYDSVHYATTHNAMSNAADGWTGPNQNLDVPAQLEAGVRALMLDTYRAGDLNGIGLVQVPGVDPDTPYLCHSFCSIGSQPLVDGLSEIRAFLDDNPGEVVTLIVESYLNHSLTAGAFDEAGLSAYAYTHPGGAWPTLGQMVDNDQRLVVLQDVDVDPTYPWLMDVWDLAFETHFSNSVPADFSCNHLRGSPSNDLFILNHFLTNVFGSPALANQVNHNPLLVDRVNACETFQSTVANFITVDFVDLGDTLAVVDTMNAP